MIGSIIGGLIGNAQAQGDQGTAAGLTQESINAFRNIYVPTIEEQRIILQKLVREGELTPEMAETISQDPSAMEQITSDPRLRSVQMQALESLRKQGEEGLTLTERADLAQARRETSRDARAREQAILQDMQARGMGGSGAELAARLAGSQGASERMSAEGDRLAAMAQQKALQATAQSGQLAGQIGESDFSQASAKARAADEIARFNAANRQRVSEGNVGTRNEAQRYNLGEKQRISEANVGLTNQQEQHNKGLYQTRFQNELSKAQGLSGAASRASDYYGKEADRTRAMYTGIGAGVDQGIGALAGGGVFGGGSFANALAGSNVLAESNAKSTMDNSKKANTVTSDKNAKKDIKSGDKEIQKFLDSLSSKSYEYKDQDKEPKGKQLGILAQDAEKSDMGKEMVVETDDGKAIEVTEAVSKLLSAVANLNRRVKKSEKK